MSAPTSGGQTAWEQVLGDTESLASELQSEGWDVCVVRSGHVTPVPPSASQSRHGLVYIAPDSVGEELPALVEASSFERYEVFKAVVAGKLYVVTRLRDDDKHTAVVLAGAVDLERARPLAEAVRDREQLHAHVRLLDGTYLTTFRYENPTQFFPEDG